MRRKANWAVLGTSGVLAAIVATMFANQPGSPGIVVPQAQGTALEVPGTSVADKVFLPPVVVTMETTVPPPPPATGPAAKPRPAAPKAKAPAPAAPPQAPPATKPQRQWSYWDWYMANRGPYYGGGYRYDGGYRDGYHDGGYYGGYRDGYNRYGR